MTVNPHGLFATVLESRMRGNPDPSWSPDSRKIVYVPHEMKQQIWVMDADGSDKRRVTSDHRGHLEASWQPR